MDDDGLQSAAILLMSLGEVEAANVLKHLAPKEVQSLGKQIAELKSITVRQVGDVLERFVDAAAAQVHLVGDTDQYVADLLRKALGDDRAQMVIDRILQQGDTAGIESFRWMSAETVADLLRNEHPQILAAILVHLERGQAADVLIRLEERPRNEVLMRVATFCGVHSMALRDLNDHLGQLVATGDVARKMTLGGPKAAAEILNLLGSTLETSALDYVRGEDGELAQAIEDSMFTFDDILRIDNAGVQLVLKELQTESLVVALKGATTELRDRVFENMSTRAAEVLREDLESRGAVRVSEVKAEQREILRVVRRLAEAGTIVIAGGGGSEDKFI